MIVRQRERRIVIRHSSRKSSRILDPTSLTNSVRLLSSIPSPSSPPTANHPMFNPSRFHAMLPLSRSRHVIVTGRNGYTNEAFRLAEQYHDYRSLAALCTKEIVYPPEMNPNGAMIEMYVEKFGEAFTDELFQWYIEHGASSFSSSPLPFLFSYHNSRLTPLCCLMYML